MSEEARAAAGIGSGLLRLSVGIEDVRNLQDDLRRALDRSTHPADHPLATRKVRA
jgi:cystathionine beta-lyase/cystathionine gamma-synthase